MTERHFLWLILVVGLVLRLVFGLAQDPNAPYTSPSADSGWYLANGYALVTGKQPGSIATDVSRLAPPPVYFIVIGVPQALLSPAAAVIAIRIFQALISTATCYFAYRLAALLTGRERAGLLAAFALVFSPVFIVEAAQILTETVCIFLITGGVWLYVESLGNRVWGGVPLTPAPSPTQAVEQVRLWGGEKRSRLLYLALAAVLLGLATLTRAVFLAFPFGLAIHLLLVYGWRAGWKRVAAFGLVYALVVLSWTAYSLARWNRFVIAGEGMSANLYLGTTDWNGPQGVDQQLEQQSPSGDYLQAAGSTIGADPVGWVKRRVGELAEAYLQPHGTVFYPGASLRELALKWAREDRSLAGLIALTQGNAFWAKLALYLLHYTALIAGAVGMWRYRRRWQVALPMIGLIGYLTLVHLALYALPRYLFPTEVFWWVFAAAALSGWFSRRRRVDATM